MAKKHKILGAKDIIDEIFEIVSDFPKYAKIAKIAKNNVSSMLKAMDYYA